MNVSQKLSFPALIFVLLESQKPLEEPNEFLSAFVQPYVFRLKEKGVVTQGEQESSVAIEEPVANPEPPVLQQRNQ